MHKERYKHWLQSSVNHPSNYVSRIKTLERYYGDIDILYDMDGCASLLAEFEYTASDKNNKREPKHRIPIEPKPGGDRFRSYYEGSKDYSSRIKKYIEFREKLNETQFDRIVQPRQSGTSEKFSGTPKTLPVLKGSKKNARFKGTPIGNAQNYMIRTILSNLGEESFSEKDWEETKEYFGNKCVYCGASDREIVRDHAVPINRYSIGEHKLGNIVPACRDCNSRKGEQDYAEFCDENEDAIITIEKYMESRKYAPITKDKQKSKGIRIILHKAHEEIRIVADKYIELINDLFFTEDPKG